VGARVAFGLAAPAKSCYSPLTRLLYSQMERGKTMVTNGDGRRRGSVGRPKRYRAHQDRGALVLRPDTSSRLLHWLDTEASPALQQKFEERGGLLAKPDLYPVVPITFNDPRCCMLVVDACFQSEPQSYLRAADVCSYLKPQYPQWYWDVTVMGRILSGIRSACEEDYRNANRYVEDPGDLPFAMGRDGRGRYYVIDPLGGNEGRLWLWTLKGALMGQSMRQMFSDQMGEFKAHHAHDNNAGWLSEVAQGPVRTKEAYEAQLVLEAGADVVPGAWRPIPTSPDYRRMYENNQRVGAQVLEAYEERDAVAAADRAARRVAREVAGRPAGE
jgi:hypothetical protein